jgi:uncharacterized membrane protein YkvA (DUF1232 family)
MREVVRQGRLAWRLFVDGRVPLAAKLIPAIAVGYLIWPIDLAPDVIPGLGQIDDLLVLLIALKVFIEMSPPEVVAEFRRQGDARTVTTTYRVADDDPPSEDGEADDLLISG